MFAPILDSLCSALLAFSGTCFIVAFFHLAGCSTDVVILIVEELKGCNWGESLEKHLGAGEQGWMGQMGKKSLKQLLENLRNK